MKKGDRVVIKRKSKWNDGSRNNPMGVVGIITKHNRGEYYSLSIEVDWGKGVHNSYDEKDLTISRAKL